MDAIILFSGGKDSIAAYRKAIKNGYNIVAGFTYGLKDDGGMFEAIAESAGIPNYTVARYTTQEITDNTITKLISDQLLQIKSKFPATTLIIGADSSQGLALWLFYLRIAHATGLKLYIPYLDCYDTDFFDDLKSDNVEVRLWFFQDTITNPPNYNPGDILPIDFLKSQFDQKVLSVISEAQTFVTNASFFKHPVSFNIVNGVIQAQ